MRIGFVVNSIETEEPFFTTTRLARAGVEAGHEVWLIGVEDLAHEPGGSVRARARGTRSPGASLDEFMEAIRDGEGESIIVDELDVLMLRNDPAEDSVDRPWAVAAPILFGELAVARGVLVVNDPVGLATAMNKTYFQHFPAVARPRTLISRTPEDITAFVDSLDGRAVLKPLQGSGGAGVFVVADEEAPNLNQIIDAISRDGFVVAQEYLPDADAGDVRMFMMNGEPLCIEGRYAAFRRVNESADVRSNMHVGGKAEPVEVTQELLDVARLATPKLVADGMFLVGLDIVGTRLMEVNVFSPGGFGTVQELYGIDAAGAVIDALAAKAERQVGEDPIDNRRLAVL